MPLPADVGAAIVAYLRGGRPAGALDRTVFIAAQAPREALAYTGITTIVAGAAALAGIPGPVHAHRLRHSAATAMLRGGGSLTEIGQALRHARPATTAIYANSRKLHQAGEKPQVSRSGDCRNGVPLVLMPPL
jgi:site-specific recombinase XerD